LRISALRDLQVLDTAPEQMFDDIATLAAQVCGTPIALISLVDEHRQWFKARVGLQAQETPRDPCDTDPTFALRLPADIGRSTDSASVVRCSGGFRGSTWATMDSWAGCVGEIRRVTAFETPPGP
jgi:hypothetical protein